MAKENERKEAKERKRKQDGGLFINPHSNTARTRKATPALHVQLRGGWGCGGGDSRQLLPAPREGLCAVGVVLPPLRPSADY